jgi:4-amino-4-deoxy-L-arabinose transferase-like glycosyltransferase
MNSTPANLLITGIYYVIVGLMGFFSLFGVYILIRYGKSKIFAFVLAAVYAFFFLEILNGSYQTLHTLLS